MDSLCSMVICSPDIDKKCLWELYSIFKGKVQLNNNARLKVWGDNTNEHGIIVFINSAIEMKNISFKVFSYTLCL